MGRRASSGLNATAIIGIAAVVLVVIVGGALVLKKGKKEGFTGQPLPLQETFSNATAMRRNEYTVEGTVFRIESRDSGVGVCLMVESDSGEEEAVFVKVPEDIADIATINLERDVTYAFKIRVDEGGVNVATAIKKP
ncbi:MAG: hypothetical protein VYA27_11070 [Verrucomicrobiota bacterium]|nr:hypothetical protein [Verrucomicrobiota bacterium]